MHELPAPMLRPVALLHRRRCTRASWRVQRPLVLTLLTLFSTGAPSSPGDVPELVFPGAISKLPDSVRVATLLRRPMQVMRGEHRWTGPIELAQRERLILAGADPPRQYVGEARPEAVGVPAVLCGQWQMKGGSSGAFCDGARLVSRISDAAETPVPRTPNPHSCMSTVLVESGPWYFDHVWVWAHGGIALHVNRAGTVLGRASSFGGEASALGLQATSAVLCQGGTVSLSLQVCPCLQVSFSCILGLFCVCSRCLLTLMHLIAASAALSPG